jgi:hypothetical protein
MTSNSNCDKLRNPFIKDASNEIYSINDDIIEKIRETYVGVSSRMNDSKLQKLKIFKKNVLPQIMGVFKNKFKDFNMYNSHAMELLVLSNTFKQFNDFYLNREYFPYLDGINELIENKNSIIETDEESAIDNLYKEIENAEQIYFKNNKIYKESIIKFIAALALKYFGEFRGYADFETTKSIVELNTLKSYNNYLTKNVITLLNSGKSRAEVQKEINKTFNSIINVFPSADYEYFPREIDDFIEDYNETNKNGKVSKKFKLIQITKKNESAQKNVISESPKMQRLNEKIRTLEEDIEIYSKTFIKEIQDEETNYKNIIELFNKIIKIEQKEEALFTDLQSTRNQLNAKIKEIGKGIQDKKYSLLKNEYDNAYKNYTMLVCQKIDLYKQLKNKMTPSTSTSQSTTSPSTNKKTLSFQKFNLNYIFDQIFKNGIIDEKCENNDKLEENYRKHIFNYLYKEVDKGIDDIKLESCRNQDKRNIYEFTLYMNDIFEYHVGYFQSKIDYYNSLKQKVETELSILKSMEDSAKTQLAEKQSYLTSLTSDIKDFEKKKSDLITNMDKKKSAIDKDLGSSIITSAFGSINVDTLSKKDYNPEEAYIVKVYNKPSFDNIIDNIITKLNSLKEEPTKTQYSVLITQIINIFQYKKLSNTSSSFTSSDVTNFNTLIETELKKKLINKLNGTTAYQNSNNMDTSAINHIRQLSIDFINQKKDNYLSIYNKDVEEILKNDSGFKKANDALVLIISNFKSYQEDNRKLREYEEKLYTLKSEEKEIKEGPEEFTKQYNAKNTYNKRIDEYLKQLNKICDSKKKSNEELQKLIGTDAFKTSLEALYNALISRYKSIYDLIKRNNIRSEVYNMFSSDFLYKITKTLHDLISPNINIEGKNQKEAGKIPPESVVEVAKSYQNYVNERLEDFPKLVEKDDGIMKFKRYQLQSMSNVLKGQKIGSYYIKPNSNMKEFVKKIKNEDINDITFLVKKLYNKNLSIDQINKEKLGKYMRNYANIEKSFKVTGGAVNKVNQIIHMPKEGVEKYFMKNMYKILLADNTNTSKEFVEKLHKIEYKMLMAAKAKLRTFTYLYKDKSSGANKIKDHFVLLYNMTKICLDDFDAQLTNIFKRGKATTKRINLLMISKYIYMEMIMIYALSYFC